MLGTRCIFGAGETEGEGLLLVNTAGVCTVSAGVCGCLRASGSVCSVSVEEEEEEEEKEEEEEAEDEEEEEEMKEEGT